MYGKMLHSGSVAPGELVQGEVRSSDAHADKGRADALFTAEDFFQKSPAVGLVHQQKVVAAGLCYRQAKAVYALVAFSIKRNLVEIDIFRLSQRYLGRLHPGSGDGGGIHLGFG